jgi:glycosyltransferase involved in cell wall biosynthesis
VDILFLSHYFTPEGNAPANRVHALTRAWVAAGHRVRVVTCAPNVPDGVVYPGYANRWRHRETIDGVEVTRVWTYLAPNKGTGKRILNYVSYLASALPAVLFARRPDVIIATSPQFFCGWTGVLYRWLRRAPFVLEIRDLWPESIEAVGALGSKPLLRFLEGMERTMYRTADHIVTVGEGYRGRLVQRGVPTEKISVVMNGVDLDRFEPRPGDVALRRAWGLEGRFVCSYIGTVGMACGLHTVLAAAQQLAENINSRASFLIVGDGAVLEELRAEAARRNLSNVVFTGRQPKERMADYLAISDASLVHLRRTELFTTVMPSKIFESAGMARPIIMGVDGEARRIVDAAGAGLHMEPENAAQLVEAVLRLEGDPALCERLGRSGCAFVREHFDRSKLADDYLRILGRIASPRSIPERTTS